MVVGWLEVIPDDGRPVEYFDTVGGIASVKPKRFLVRTSIVGYQLTTEDNGNSCWMPYEIKPGEVLTTGIIYMDTKKTKNTGSRNILKRILKQNKAKKEKDLKYLQCFNFNGWEIMIPFIMTGVFSPVGDSSVANYDAVYELQDLIIAFGLPVNAQLIHANSNDDNHCPRGVIRLYGTREEELAIVSNVGSDGALFCENSNCDKFEIPVDKIMCSRGVLKKKPVIKSTLVERFSYPHKKMTNQNKPEEYEVKDKDYVTAKSVNDFRLRATYEQMLYAPTNDKNNSVYASYTGKYAPVCEEKRDLDGSKHSQLVTHATNDTQSPSRNTVLSDSNTKASLISAPSKEIVYHPHDPEQNTKTDVELPERVPNELKKSRSTSILDKLSVRKVKKERSKLKELRGDDVFSKRISRSELSYQDFFNGLDKDDEEPKNTGIGKSNQDDSGRGSSGGTYQSISSSNSGGGVCSTSTPCTVSKTSSKAGTDTTKSLQNRKNLQKRDLPPIPPDAQTHTGCISPNHSVSKESLYEHLPPAPQPPHFRRASDSALLDDVGDYNAFDDEENNDDGYMVPVQLQQEPRYTKRSDVQLTNRPIGLANDSLKSARARKARSELPREFAPKADCYDYSHSLDTDDLFNFAYTSRKYGESHPLGNLVGQSAASTSQLYGTVKGPPRRLKLTECMSNFDWRFRDKLDVETRDPRCGSRHNSRHFKNINHNQKATFRSHSLRKTLPSGNEFLNYPESVHNIRGGNSLPNFNDFQNRYMQNAYDHQGPYINNSRPQVFSCRSIEASMMSHQLQQHQQQMNYCCRGSGMHYAESEPNFHQNSRAVSLGGISDSFFKQGDDSAISMCSRGEAGFPNESDYSYNGYGERTDDEWTPPEQLDGLSVQGVSKSLHYIGMKDRVILRFSKEQIDGNMLCTLDKKLLKEGFPELNALEIKKIMDFVQGWRPKKS